MSEKVNISALVQKAHASHASDIHLVCGLPPRMRVGGQLEDLDDHVLTSDDCEDIARELCGGRYEKFLSVGELDFALNFGDVRCRLNTFRQQGHSSVALRILEDKIPRLDSLGLPPVVNTFPDFDRGLILVTGQTGSGKSTTLAALIDAVNHTRHQHIITLEDPVEYMYVPDKCTINQRQVGLDTATFESGLNAVLREDPDIILIGELRSLETIEAAITAAETGHLVFATLHTNSAPDTVDRIVNVFPGDRQQQIRMQLSTSLKAVLAQQLLPRADGKGRVLACEVMVTNDAIKNQIREGKTPAIMNTIATTEEEGNLSMDSCLVQLAIRGKIATEHAVNAAYDTETVRAKLERGPKTQVYREDAVLKPRGMTMF